MSSLSDVVFEPVSPSAAAQPALRRDLLGTWVAVTDAGGAVGFTAPADAQAIADLLDAALARVTAGRDALGILRRSGTAVGMGLLVDGGSALQRHWRTVLRLMVHPELQGIGAGRRLLEGLHGVARQLELEQLRLSVRGGTGLEPFYERFGYVAVGRHPGAIRVAPGDDRDEITMVVALTPPR